MLNDLVKITRNLLSHLCYKWVERRGSFDVGGQVVEFNLLNVCLGLGLRILGERNDLNEIVVDSDNWNIFGGEIINVKLIYDYLLKFDDDIGGV